MTPKRLLAVPHPIVAVCRGEGIRRSHTHPPFANLLRFQAFQGREDHFGQKVILSLPILTPLLYKSLLRDGFETSPLAHAPSSPGHHTACCICPTVAGPRWSGGPYTFVHPSSTTAQTVTYTSFAPGGGTTRFPPPSRVWSSTRHDSSPY